VDAGQLSLPLIRAGIKKLAQPTVLDRLLKQIRKHPEVPVLDRRMRRRLQALLRTDAATNALLDQDVEGEAALSVLLASDVFRTPESNDSVALAQALITEYVGVLDADVRATVIAYKLRRMETSAQRRQIAEAHDQVAGYRQTIQEELAPVTELFGREAELAELARFCAGPQPYAWWQADAWAGKTALLAWFALHPPDSTDVVCFFVRGIPGESDRRGFLTRVLPELSVLTDKPVSSGLSVPAGTDLYRGLLNTAAKRAQEKSRRLILVVDGLDEDTGPPAAAIAMLLPRQPDPALRVIVASRPPLNALTQLPWDHPLRICDKTILAPSPHARGIAERAEQELRELLTGNATGRDLIGLIAAAEGPLTTDDLAELTDMAPGEIKSVLAGRAGRSLKTHTTMFGSAIYRGQVLGHPALREQPTPNSALPVWTPTGPRSLAGPRPTLNCVGLKALPATFCSNIRRCCTCEVAPSSSTTSRSTELAASGLSP
jgi:hypothetical protein